MKLSRAQRVTALPREHTEPPRKRMLTANRSQNTLSSEEQEVGWRSARQLSAQSPSKGRGAAVGRSIFMAAVTAFSPEQNALTDFLKISRAYAEGDSRVMPRGQRRKNDPPMSSVPLLKSGFL